MSVGSRQTRRERRARRKGAELKELGSTVLARAVAMVHGVTRGVEWHVLFFALLFSLVGVVVSVLADEAAFAVLFFLSSLFLYVALWKRDAA